MQRPSRKEPRKPFTASFMKAVHRVYVRIGGRRIRYLLRELRQRRLGCWVVNSAGVALRIDPADLRGQQLFAAGGALDKNALALWRHLVEAFHPNVVLDVGANYGEVAFSYPLGSEVPIHLVEANPRIAKILSKTIEPVRGVVLHEGAAADREGIVRLYGARILSGCSSINRGTNRESVRVKAFRLDERITVAPNDRLLFKIDVEGAETDVLRGMTRLLQTCTWRGIVEIAHLNEDQLHWLASAFRVHLARIDGFGFIPLPEGQVLDARTLKGMGVSKDAVIESLK